ncbi:MAG: molybdenum cofactor guanylyltransferase [Ignavibacteriae bacterium]|nr:molybdenum cofactor guanylyltransferase [Ignavibacteriota bacterium]NOG98480.1 molybdenum cofactor guanylyltransferase [Ignavibacteriota bacterium]
MFSDITGIILAGGKSTRMGVNKSFLKIGDETIIERIFLLMNSIFNKVIIITNTPEEYVSLGVPVFKDIYVGKGPMGGIHSGLTHSSTEKNFVISCDVPLMTREMIEYIIEYKSDKPVKYCEAAGYHQPMAGYYTKAILNELETVITSSDKNIEKPFHNFLKEINSEIIHPQEKSFYKDEIFFNMNGPKDYEWLIANYS